MNRILRFGAFNNISEKIQHITANWYAISDEASFEKKEGCGYFIFNKNGVFSIDYFKNKGEESILDFYFSKESSPDKMSLCSCKIVNKKGEITKSKKFEDIDGDNIIDILSFYFDYCDLEDSDDDYRDRFFLGLIKSLKVIFAHDLKDSLPASFLSFSKEIEKLCKEFPKIEDSKIDHSYKIVKLIKDFIRFYNESII